MALRGSYAVRPVVRRLVQPHPFQPQVVAVHVAVGGVEDGEGGLREVFRSRHYVEHHGLVARHAREEVAHRMVAAIDQKGVIPCIHHLLLGDAFHVGEVHHHALLGRALGRDEVAGQRDLDRIAMAVQVFALAVVVGDAMSGIEFQAAGDEHDGCGRLTGADYSIEGLNPIFLNPIGVSEEFPFNAFHWLELQCSHESVSPNLPGL